MLNRWIMRLPDGALILILWFVLPVSVTFFGLWVQDGISEAARVTTIVAGGIAGFGLVCFAGFWLLVGIGELFTLNDRRRERRTHRGNAPRDT